MTEIVSKVRRFSVRARSMDSHHARVVNEASFEAAAIAYAEDLAAADPGETEISVTVCDIESGHEHCFRLDIVAGPD